MQAILEKPRRIKRLSHCIYLLIFPNGKTYVGQTCHFHRRWYKHCHEDMVVDKAIVKYKPENVEIQILHNNLTQDQANIWEFIEIQEHNSLAKNEQGYNIKLGGKCSAGHKYTDEQRAKRKEWANQLDYKSKMSDTLKNLPDRLKINAKIGAAQLGKKVSEDTKERHRQALLGVKHTDERIANNSAGQNIPECFLKKAKAWAKRSGVSLKQHIEQQIVKYQKSLNGAKTQKWLDKYTKLLKNMKDAKHYAIEQGYDFTLTKKEQAAVESKRRKTKDEIKINQSVAAKILQNSPECLLAKAITYAERKGKSLRLYTEQKIIEYQKRLDEAKIKKWVDEYTNCLKNQKTIKQYAIKQGHDFKLTEKEQAIIKSIKPLTKDEILLKKAVGKSQRKCISLMQHVEQRIAHYRKRVSGAKTKKIFNTCTISLQSNLAVKRLATKRGIYF